MSRHGDAASKHVVAICFLADQMKEPPSKIQSWDKRDIQLMLAYYHETKRKK